MNFNYDDDNIRNIENLLNNETEENTNLKKSLYFSFKKL